MAMVACNHNVQLIKCRFKVNIVYIGKTEKKLGEHIKQHTADTASNQSAFHEHYKLTGHLLDKDNVTILCREEKTVPKKVREAIYIKKDLNPILNRDGGRELSRLYDSLLATPSSVRPPPTSRSGESNIS